MRTSITRTGPRARLACHRRWSVYGKQLPSYTRGGSRMRESRTYGSVRGACDETHVPTATSNEEARVHHAPGWCGSNVAARGARGQAAMPVIDLFDSTSPGVHANLLRRTFRFVSRASPATEHRV